MIRLFTTHDGVVLYILLLLLLLLFYSFPFPYRLFHSTNILFGLRSDFIDIDEWRTSKDVDMPSQIEYASTRLANVSCVRRSAQVVSPSGNIGTSELPALDWECLHITDQGLESVLRYYGGLCTDPPDLVGSAQILSRFFLTPNGRNRANFSDRILTGSGLSDQICSDPTRHKSDQIPSRI